MEHYQVILAYDGTNFQGFQRQGSSRTVQSEVEHALNQLGWQGRSILFAGRTDTGVHASGQVVTFELDWVHSEEKLLRALNANLPEDVAIQRVQTVPPQFHPRFDALARQYRYRLFCQKERDPLRERFAGRVWPEIDGALLQKAADLFIGSHDFAAFGSPMKPGGSTVRTVFQAGWQTESEGIWSFQVIANAFLYRMVRRLVFIQVRVGQQRLSCEDIAAAISTQTPLVAGLAKPSGLTLENVYYDESELKAERVKITASASGEEDSG